MVIIQLKTQISRVLDIKNGFMSCFRCLRVANKAGSGLIFFPFLSWRATCQLSVMFFFSQISTSAASTMGDVIMCVETQWAASSAAARKATSCWPMREHVKVGSSFYFVFFFFFPSSPLEISHVVLSLGFSLHAAQTVNQNVLVEAASACGEEEMGLEQHLFVCLLYLGAQQQL